MATFEHFYKTLRSDDKVKWKDFEKFVKWYLKTDPRWMSLVKEIWLWDEHPKREEWGPDNGIDLVFEHINGEIWAVQAKCFAPQNSIRKEHMDSFIAESSDSRFQKRLLVASTNNIGPNVDRLLKRHEVVRILLQDLEDSDIEYPANPNDYSTAKRKDPPKPFDHQKEAIECVINQLKKEDKGQVHMACGTGKTLTSLWIKESLKVENVLVLLPSLSLLSQTLKEWHKAAKEPFKWICVCSDKTVAKEDETEDKWIKNTSEIGIPVTGDFEVIKKFLLEKGSKIIFSTYQSSELIVQVQKNNSVPDFDITFADEAHRCAGKVSSTFAYVLDEKKIRSRKRLFFTATPKVLSKSIKKQSELNDIEVASMDDYSLFGNIFYQLKFSDAINRNPPLLTDYQVVVVGIDDPMIQERILNRDFLTTDGENVIDAERLASNIAIIKSIKDYDLRRIISFHGRVKSAESFSKDLVKISRFVPNKDKPEGEINCEHISGSMKSSLRNEKLKRLKFLKDDERRLLTNARCLSEGVDVPTLDGIAFIDPRSSQIDIIQAVGRAIRKSPNKQIGTIILPVYLGNLDNVEDEIVASKFNDIWRIILALKSQDDSLMETIDRLRISLGQRGERGTRGNGLEKIIFDLPERVNKSFAESIKTYLVNKTSNVWYQRYGELLKYVEEKGKARPPQTISIGSWCTKQRMDFKKGILSKEYINKLECLEGWVWFPDDSDWYEKYDQLIEFIKENGYSNVPKEQGELGRWVGKQRSLFRKGKLKEFRVNLLNQIDDWIWNPQERFWEENIKLLKEYVKDNGHSKPPKNTKVGKWVCKQRQRYAKDLLDEERVKILENFPDWTWNTRDTSWMDIYEKVVKYVEENGVLPPQRVPKIGSWLTIQRTRYKKKLQTKERIELLEKIEIWEWDEQKSLWEKNYENLKNLIKEVGKYPTYKSDRNLYEWCHQQRRNYRNGVLSDKTIKLLESIKDWKW